MPGMDTIAVTEQRWAQWVEPWSTSVTSTEFPGLALGSRQEETPDVAAQ